jgi:hypothetical protein
VAQPNRSLSGVDSGISRVDPDEARSDKPGGRFETDITDSQSWNLWLIVLCMFCLFVLPYVAYVTDNTGLAIFGIFSALAVLVIDFMYGILKKK